MSSWYFLQKMGIKESESDAHQKDQQPSSVYKKHGNLGVLALPKKGLKQLQHFGLFLPLFSINYFFLLLLVLLCVTCTLLS